MIPIHLTLLWLILTSTYCTPLNSIFHFFTALYFIYSILLSTSLNSPLLYFTHLYTTPSNSTSFHSFSLHFTPLYFVLIPINFTLFTPFCFPLHLTSYHSTKLLFSSFTPISFNTLHHISWLYSTYFSPIHFTLTHSFCFGFFFLSLDFRSKTPIKPKIWSDAKWILYVESKRTWFHLKLKLV